MQQLMHGLPIKQFLNCLLVVSLVSVHLLVLNSDSPESLLTIDDVIEIWSVAQSRGERWVF